jgi:hypothetical protein
MPRRLASRWLAVPLASVLCTGSTLLLQSALCVGAGGHLAIEIVNAGCCHDVHAESRDAVEGDDCGTECTDTSLSLDATKKEGGDLGTVLPVGPSPLLAIFVRDGTLRHGHSFSAPRLPAVSPPRELRSTVQLL